MKSGAMMRTGVLTMTFLMSLSMFVGCASVGGGMNAAPEVLMLKKQHWPFEGSDLPHDPDTFFGRLPNGVRFVFKENKTPVDRVSMHLFVQAGSLAERQGEEGMAHFLEHMLFNGSENFPPGEMVKYFQRIGMKFGPDANAHTGFGQTVFDILLPKGDAKSITEGLLVLKDYAQGALLLPEEVEKEKGVVLAEMRSRDSVRYRTFKASLAFETPGTLLSKRLPIGKKADILAYTPEALRAFYQSWYHPDRLVIVMVGQFDKQLAPKLIEEQFGGLKSLGQERQLPVFGNFRHEGTKVFYHYEKEAGNTSVEIESVVEHRFKGDSKAFQKKMLLEDLASRIIQKRLDALLQNPESGLTGARASSGMYLQQIRYAQISADCKPQNWNKSLSAIEQTLRQALQYGFDEMELAVAKSDFLAELQKEVNEENTADSRRLASDIMNSLDEWTVYQSPTQHKEMFDPLLKNVAVQEVNDAFRAVWPDSHRLVLVTGNADLGNESQAADSIIMAAYQNSRTLAVSQPVAQKTAIFPYLPVPDTAGAIEIQRQYEDLGIQEVLFVNGFRLLLKQTDYKENEVAAALSFGKGQSSEPENKPGLAKLTQSVVNESGFGKMDRIALERALSGKLAKISFRVAQDRFVVDGTAAKDALSTLFQLMQTFLQDPAFRTDALKVVMKRFEENYNAFNHSIEGIMRLEGKRFLAGGDSRFGWPAWEQMQQLNEKDIEQWFGAQLNKSPLELVLVGDFDPDQVIASAARYFGTLEPREADDLDIERDGPTFPESQRLDLAVDTAIEKALVVVSYPTDDFWDISRTRRLNTLADVLSERLRLRIREKLGAAYSPYAYHRAYRAYKGYGYLQTVVVVDPALTDTIVSEIENIAQELVDSGIDQDELRRAVDPTLAKIKDFRRDNSYWLNSVMSGAGLHPEQLEWARTIVSDFTAITAEQLEVLAKKYLINAKAAAVVVKPVQTSARAHDSAGSDR